MKKFKGSDKIYLKPSYQDDVSEETLTNVMNQETFQKFTIECCSTLIAEISSIKNDVSSIKSDLQIIKTLLTSAKKSNTVTTHNTLKDLNKTSTIQSAFTTTAENSSKNVIMGSIKHISLKYAHNVPFKSIEDFFTFDEELKRNKSLVSDVSMILENGLDINNVVSKSFVSMLKMFFTKEVAVKFVANRHVNNKHIMKKTNFFSIMRDVVIEQRRRVLNVATTEKEITSALSCVLSNSVAWYRSRTSTGDPSKTKETEKLQNEDPISTVYLPVLRPETLIQKFTNDSSDSEEVVIKTENVDDVENFFLDSTFS